MESNASIAVNDGKLLTTVLQTNDHKLFADEPVENGGMNLGPSPGDFLRMSLASCTAITLRMYANHKKIDVQKIEVNVSSKQIDDATVFERVVSITGILDAAQHKRMLQVANACPVHKVLTHTIHIKTSLFTI